MTHLPFHRKPPRRPTAPSTSTNSLISSEGSKTGRWSELPNELLLLVLHRLNIKDHVNFGWVCRNWSAATAEISPTSKPIWLVPTAYPVHLINRFLLQTGWHRCIGSHEGWLAMADYDDELYLFNRPLKSRISLPRTFVQQFGSVTSIRRSTRKLVMSSDPNSTDCVFAILYGCSDELYSDVNCPNELAFCTRDDKKWKILEGGCLYADITFHEGRLWALADGSLTAFEFRQDGCGGMVSAGTVTVPAPNIMAIRSYLVVESCSNKLILVSKDNFFALKVWEIETAARSFMLIRLKSLGNQALLLSRVCSRSISADAGNRHAGIVKDTVYFSFGEGHSSYCAFDMDQQQTRLTHCREEIMVGLFFHLFGAGRKKSWEMLCPLDY